MLAMQAEISTSESHACIREAMELVGPDYTGRARFSLKELGVKPVKGPLNAFRLSDRLDVETSAEVGAPQS